MSTELRAQEGHKANLPKLDGFSVGIVVAEWNPQVTEALLKGALDVFHAEGYTDDNILVEHVPGTVELTYGAACMIDNVNVEAVIVIGCVIRGGTPHFDYVCDSVQWLDGSSAGFSNFHLVFMMRLTRFVGVYPNMEGYVEGYCFDMQNGCFVSSAFPGRGFLDAEDSRIMYLLMRMDYGSMHLFKMSHEERNRCLDVVLDFYRLHVPDFGELKSLQVLRDMFGTI